MKKKSKRRGKKREIKERRPIISTARRLLDAWEGDETGGEKPVKRYWIRKRRKLGRDPEKKERRGPSLANEPGNE